MERRRLQSSKPRKSFPNDQWLALFRHQRNPSLPRRCSSTRRPLVVRSLKQEHESRTGGRRLQGAGPPEVASSGGRVGHEMAPGTPTQQAPHLLMLQPTPNAPEGIAQPLGGGVIFMQGRHGPPPTRSPVPRLVPPSGGAAPPEMGYQRHMAMRRDAGPLPHGSQLSQVRPGAQTGGGGKVQA